MSEPIGTIRSAHPPLAVLGGAPALAKPLPVGQLHFPAWSAYETAMRELFERQYYTNHGPLVQRFEAALRERLSVRHVVCVTNATIGLMMAVDALDLSGKVIVPAFTFIATVQAMSWAGLEPVFCDVDLRTHLMTPEFVEPLIDADVSAILPVNLWGDACPPAPLQTLADRHGLQLFFDSAHAFGCEIDARPVGNFGALEVFSFHATKVLSATEGGCICTNDDALAARLRNIRSSYGAGPLTAVPKTSNGRMSEAQAAIGLLNLERLGAVVERNREVKDRYHERLGQVTGLRLHLPRHATRTNFQYVIFEVDEDAFGLSRDELLEVLGSENIVARRYFYPGVHRSAPYRDELPRYIDRLPNTDHLGRRLIQLPSGAPVSAADVDRVCDCIELAHAHAGEVRDRLSGR